MTSNRGEGGVCLSLKICRSQQAAQRVCRAAGFSKGSILGAPWDVLSLLGADLVLLCCVEALKKGQSESALIFVVFLSQFHSLPGLFGVFFFFCISDQATHDALNKMVE